MWSSWYVITFLSWPMVDHHGEDLPMRCNCICFQFWIDGQAVVQVHTRCTSHILFLLTFAVWYTFNRCDCLNCRQENLLLAIVAVTNNSQFILLLKLMYSIGYVYWTLHAHAPITLTTIEPYLKIGLLRIFLNISSKSVGIKTLLSTLAIMFSIEVSVLFSLRGRFCFGCCQLIWWENAWKAILIGPIVCIVHTQTYAVSTHTEQHISRVYVWHVLNKYTKLFWFCKQR